MLVAESLAAASAFGAKSSAPPNLLFIMPDQQERVTKPG